MSRMGERRPFRRKDAEVDQAGPDKRCYTSAMKRHEVDNGTVLTIQTPVGSPGTKAAALAVLFDGRPMINAGVSGTLRTLQDEAIIPPLMLVCVESIEGSTPRGPSRCA